MDDGLCEVEEIYLWKAAKKRVLWVGVRVDIFGVLGLKVN